MKAETAFHPPNIFGENYGGDGRAYEKGFLL